MNNRIRLTGLIRAIHIKFQVKASDKDMSGVRTYSTLMPTILIAVYMLRISWQAFRFAFRDSIDVRRPQFVISTQICQARKISEVLQVETVLR